MSAYHIIRAIEEEAHRPGEGSLAYELEIVLRSGRIVRCAPYKADSYKLKVCEYYHEPQRNPSAEKIRKERITYIDYDAIDQVTPIWL